MTGRFADIRWVDETGSTNADVLALARAGAPEGVVVVADHQTAGRGRRGRTWEAPPGASLMGTVLLRPPAEVAGLATMALGLAAAEAVHELTGLDVGLKWPNDLVWPAGEPPDRKLAGILAEADWTDPRAPAVAVGIGLNVDWRGSMPAELAGIAVSLDELTAPSAPPTRQDLLDALLRRLDVRYAELLSYGGPPALRDAWIGRSATLGRRVRVELGGEVLEGLAASVTAEGHLELHLDDGRAVEVAAGDVVHLRPA